MGVLFQCPHCRAALTVEVATSRPNPKPVASPPLAFSDDIGELLNLIDMDSLDAKSADFVATTRERFAKWKDKILMTERQLAWLRKLAAGAGNKDEHF